MSSVSELSDRIEELETKVHHYEELNTKWASTVNELNNLLAAMKGHAQLASMQPSADKVVELVKVVLTTVTRVQELVRTSNPVATDENSVVDISHRHVDPSQVSILVVDDEMLIRSLLYELLVKTGYNVSMSGSGKDAIEECKDKIFDVILMDFRLGDMNGVQALRQIREFQQASRVVFLTGDPSIETIQKTVLQEGADGFVTKPFDLKEIVEVVKHLLQMKG